MATLLLIEAISDTSDSVGDAGAVGLKGVLDESVVPAPLLTALSVVPPSSPGVSATAVLSSHSEPSSVSESFC